MHPVVRYCTLRILTKRATLLRPRRSTSLKVLEVGVVLGADHQQFAEAGADLFGIDLTERAVEHTQQRLGGFGLTSHLAVGDAETLDFTDEPFDLSLIHI